MDGTTMNENTTDGKTLDGKNKVAVLGASDNPDRYSHMLIKRLRGKGQEVFPINPGLTLIAGLPVFRAVGTFPPASMSCRST